MEYNFEISLVSVEITVDELGDKVETETLNTILASKIDYKTKSYYEALTSGLKPSITFGINKHDYADEELLKYDNKYFKIIDVSPVKVKIDNEFESLALICEKVI